MANNESWVSEILNVCEQYEKMEQDASKIKSSEVKEQVLENIKKAFFEEIDPIIENLTPEEKREVLDEVKMEVKRRKLKKLQDMVDKAIASEQEIPDDLKNYREEWKKNIKNIDEESKQKIIEAAEKIIINVETDSDGSRLIKFKVWWKKWTILDPKLSKNNDERNDTVQLLWITWDNTYDRKNKRLAKYVRQKQEEWLHIPKIEEMKDLLGKLWDEAGLDSKSNQIAMLMYLTGMHWHYRLSMWDNERSINNQDISRSRLTCKNDVRGLYWDKNIGYDANLCMMSCE